MLPRIGLGSGDRGSLDSDEFETCPVWVPGVDMGRAGRSDHHENNTLSRVRSQGQLGGKSSKRVQTGEATGASG
jgi:hypothetical protein